MIIPSELHFTAERLMKSQGRTGTADNDINAIVSMGMIPQGYRVNNYLTDTDAFYIITDVPNGMKMFTRAPLTTCLLYTSPSPRDVEESRMPSSA